MRNYFDLITKYLTPAIPVQRRDATSVEVKEPIKPVKRTFSSPEIEAAYNLYIAERPWDLTGAETLVYNLEKQQSQSFTQGTAKTEEQKRQAAARVERQGAIEKEAQDRLKAAEVVSKGLDYTSPSYWINEYGGALGTAESLGLDLATYLALGGLRGMAKNGLVILSKNGVKKVTPKMTKKLTELQAARKVEDLIPNKPGISPQVPAGEDLSHMVSEHRDLLANYYNSDSYKQRLLKAGLSEEQANARVGALTENIYSTPVINYTLGENELGKTLVTGGDKNAAKILVDLNKTKDLKQFDSTILEELTHASELNSVSNIEDLELLVAYNKWESLKTQIPFEQWYKTQSSKEFVQDYSKNLLTALHNNITVPYNESLASLRLDINGIEKALIELSADPKETKRILDSMDPTVKRDRLLRLAKYYYGLPQEKRARGIGVLLKDGQLADEWKWIYKTGPDLQNYLNKFLALPLIVELNDSAKKYGGQLNYLKYLSE